MVGHSFNDSDRDGGKIENVLKKRENIYDVEGYIEVIHEAKNKNKFKVRRMEKCFVDLKKQVKDSKFVRRTVDDDGTKIKLKKGSPNPCH